ncbi:MAG: hypothetical protein FJY92_03395 [Candidatus Hydrogenedentes bacterium]|nr:hypothetical protein [Candidatus Hydrogenedentota bacterium]
MWRLLADENLNADIVRGLKLRRLDMDILSVREAGLAGADDSDILAWASKNGRIVLTHDRATMPHFAYQRVRANIPMAGLFVLNDRMPINQAIREVSLVVSCCKPAEFAGHVAYLPL